MGDLIVTLENNSAHEHIDDLHALEEKEIESMLSLSQLTPDCNLHSFAKAVVHDLRNPLSTIIGFADMLVRDRHEMSEEKIDRIAKEILNAGDKLNRMLKTASRWAHQNIDP